MNELPNRPSSPEGNSPPPEQYLPPLEQENSPENKGQRLEQGQPSGQERAKAPPSTHPPVQTPPADNATPVQTASDDAQTDDNMPIFANDVDVIEKEWVNKAKQIIKETHDNPYEQEKAVEQLQIDYLKKRYGHDVKASK